MDFHLCHISNNTMKALSHDKNPDKQIGGWGGGSPGAMTPNLQVGVLLWGWPFNWRRKEGQLQGLTRSLLGQAVPGAPTLRGHTSQLAMGAGPSLPKSTKQTHKGERQRVSLQTPSPSRERDKTTNVAQRSPRIRRCDRQPCDSTSRDLGWEEKWYYFPP